MVNFCECGADKFICQHCGRDLCSAGCGTHTGQLVSEWVEGKGNVCGRCLSNYYLKTKNGYVEVKKHQYKGAGIAPGNTAYDLMC